MSTARTGSSRDPKRRSQPHAPAPPDAPTPAAVARRPRAAVASSAAATSARRANPEAQRPAAIGFWAQFSAVIAAGGSLILGVGGGLVLPLLGSPIG